MSWAHAPVFFVAFGALDAILTILQTLTSEFQHAVDLYSIISVDDIFNVLHHSPSVFAE
ncbi:MAG: hypothetical protein R3330_13880 [Saprospiraceae bacterium]|nr:hypothetical protein [Saprospiraceae bacterium]